MSEKTIAKAVRTTGAPKGYTGLIEIEAKAYQLNGNAHPHFSVTCAIGTASQLKSGDWQAGGCMHEECAQKWPAIRPIIALHLSNADDGEPMHAEANGFYQLAGAVEGNFGERYHSGNSKGHFPITPDPETPWKNTEYRFPNHAEALASCAEYLRVSLDEAEAVKRDCLRAFKQGADSVAMSEEVSAEAEKQRSKAGNLAAKARFAHFVKTLRPQWQAEADAGLALLRSLATGGIPA